MADKALFITNLPRDGVPSKNSISLRAQPLRHQGLVHQKGYCRMLRWHHEPGN
jgi:hypothetical protein